MPDILITLGSNIDPERNIPAVIDALTETFGRFEMSPCYRSSPLDSEGKSIPGQGVYINAAILLRGAKLSYDSLRMKLREIEAFIGRKRGEDKYEPRPIDLDIAVYGDNIIYDGNGKIKVPDPEIFTKAHVVLPLADIAPDLMIPGSSRSLRVIGADFSPLERVDCD